MIPGGHWTGLRGFLLDAPSLGELRSLRDGAVIIDDQGLIAEVGDYAALKRLPRDHPVHWSHSERTAILPGLVDLHTHVPQYPAVARGTSELLPWLREHIFPVERDFTGPRARDQAGAFFAELARHGTTTACAWSAIFEDSCEASFRAAERLGLRAIIGKTMMDVGSYGKLQPQKVLSVSLAESERLCKRWHGANGGLLEYAFSPRFAPSCSARLLAGAADLAARHGAYLQTHLAENRDELERVRHLFAEARDYTDVYDAAGLFTPKTILAHCIHLSDRELEAIAGRGCAVAHCPTANLFLSSGIMELDRVVAAGIGVGLGSDVAAGPELNLWQVMRSALESQKARALLGQNNRVPTPAEVFHLATQGAANALGKGAIIGSLDIGKEADLVAIDIPALLPYRTGTTAIADLAPEDLLNLLIHRGGPHATLRTVVRGRTVWEAPQPELF